MVLQYVKIQGKQNPLSVSGTVDKRVGDVKAMSLSRTALAVGNCKRFVSYAITGVRQHL